MKGSLITLENYSVTKENGETYLVVDKFSHVGADNCPTHGDPVNVADILDASSMKDIDSLLYACDDVHVYPEKITDEDCKIPKDQQAILDTLWKKQVKTDNELLFSPVVKNIDENEVLEIIDEDEDPLQIVDENESEAKEGFEKDQVVQNVKRRLSLSDSSSDDEYQTQHIQKITIEKQPAWETKKVLSPKKSSPVKQPQKEIETDQQHFGGEKRQKSGRNKEEIDYFEKFRKKRQIKYEIW